MEATLEKVQSERASKTKRNIKKVAVLGSGVMGSGIAAHFANIGLDVLLLDIVPFNLSEEEKKKTSPLIWLMPISIIVGILFGNFVMPQKFIFVLDYSLTLSLIVLYIGVGISLGSNRMVFKYIKLLGWKIVFLSVTIFIGSIVGGILSGIILHLPMHISVMSASGMSYYSLTGAYMSQVYGVAVGTYGFMVNVMREFITILLLPFIIKISKGSPIASGASGNMDTMLIPVTKFVGPELGVVTLVTGTILTFAVPFILPMLYTLFS